MSNNTSCDKCQYIHGTDCTIAIGRFTNVVKYRGNFTNAPLRNSREEAEEDYCNNKILGKEVPNE